MDLFLHNKFNIKTYFALPFYYKNQFYFYFFLFAHASFRCAASFSGCILLPPFPSCEGFPLQCSTQGVAVLGLIRAQNSLLILVSMEMCKNMTDHEREWEHFSLFFLLTPTLLLILYLSYVFLRLHHPLLALWFLLASADFYFQALP